MVAGLPLAPTTAIVSGAEAVERRANVSPALLHATSLVLPGTRDLSHERRGPAALDESASRGPKIDLRNHIAAVQDRRHRCPLLRR